MYIKVKIFYTEVLQQNSGYNAYCTLEKNHAVIYNSYVAKNGEDY